MRERREPSLSPEGEKAQASPASGSISQGAPGLWIGRDLDYPHSGRAQPSSGLRTTEGEADVNQTPSMNSATAGPILSDAALRSICVFRTGQQFLADQMAALKQVEHGSKTFRSTNSLFEL